MPVLIGNDVYLSLDGVDVSAYWTDEISFSIGNNTVETTAGAGVTDIKRKAGLDNTTLSLVLVYDANRLSDYLSKLAVGGRYTVVYAPEGNYTGKPKHTQTMILQSMDGPNPTINKDMVKFELSFSGAEPAALGNALYDPYQTYINTVLNTSPTIFLTPNGSTFTDRVSGTTSIGTNTTAGSETDTLGRTGVVFNGTNATIDLSSLASGSINATLAFSSWLSFDNWANGETDYVFQWQVNSTNYYRLFKFSNDSLFLYHNQSGNLTQDFYSVSGLTGVHHLVAVWNASSMNLYIDNVSVADGTPAGAPTGTLTAQYVASSVGSASFMAGTIYDVAVWNGLQPSTAEIAAIYNRGSGS